MSGIVPPELAPDPLAPEALALLDIDGSKRRAFHERYAKMDQHGRNLTLRVLTSAVSHRTPQADERIDRLESRYGLKFLYNE